MYSTQTRRLYAIVITATLLALSLVLQSCASLTGGKSSLYGTPCGPYTVQISHASVDVIVYVDGTGSCYDGGVDEVIQANVHGTASQLAGWQCHFPPIKVPATPVTTSQEEKEAHLVGNCFSADRTTVVSFVDE